MNETFCNYSGKRDETIVAYLYGEMEADDRATFDRHVVACAPCRAELADLRGVRSELARWASPELASHVPFEIAVPPINTTSTRSIPVWAQAIAATLLLGVAAGVANLDVSYSKTSGLSIRTGWRHPAEASPAPTVAAPALTAQAPDSSAAPWKTDLDALARELRAVEARPTGLSTAPSGSDDALMRRVRQLVQDSERRQESELALRMAEAVRDLQMQRQADLVKIDRTLGLMQNRTGLEVMRTQRQMNSLAQQVSQRP
jgi:putative zinc finger protein